MSIPRLLPIGIQTFEIIRKGGYTYIDKTAYVYKMAHDYRYAFLSRPRRFGKSLLVSTLKSYFEGRHDLFEGLAIEQLEQEWRQHPVIHISLASAKGGTVESVKNTIGYKLGEMEKLHTQWHWAVENLAQKMEVSIDEAYAALKRKYDGYHFANDLCDVYNPFSLLNAFDDGDLNASWFETGTPTVLVQMLRKFNTDITKLDGATAQATAFDAPTEQMQSVLPLFYQSGYLTIKGYNRVTDKYTLGYPNQEVMAGMMNALAPYYVWNDVYRTDNIISDMYEAILDNDLPKAFECLKVFLAAIPYAEGATTEGHFQSLLYVVLAMMGRYLLTQVRTATGRIDCVWHSPTDVYVIELKMDKPASEAIAQIDEKGYLVPWQLDGRRLHKVGLSFSTKTRTIEEWKIEE